MYSVCEDQTILTPPDIVNAAQLLNEDLLPAKSKEKYITAYDNFIKWRNKKNTSSLSENVLLAYFGEIAVKYKAASLWAIYSMLKSTLKAKNCINIEQYPKLKYFLKRKSDGYVSKKSKILTGENVEKFISEAPDNTYLVTKVALILGVTGALRGQELSNVTVDDIENHGEMLLVKVPNTKNKIPRSFVISGNYYKIVKKYQAMRSTKATSNRFFQQIRNGKCTAQVIGKNKLGSMPKEIAQYLNLLDASSYTGHSFRRTSATLLADSGADILTLKRHGGWKSSSVAEGYIDDSFASKICISNKITESIQSYQKVTESQGPIASSSSTFIEQRPEFFKQEKITESIQPCQNTMTESRGSITSSSAIIEQISELTKEDHLTPDQHEQATNSITNSVQPQSIKFPDKNMVLNITSNSNCTITLNFNK